MGTKNTNVNVQDVTALSATSASLFNDAINQFIPGNRDTYQKVYAALERYASVLKSKKLDKSLDVELYSVVLVDTIILKTRISAVLSKAYRIDHSIFYLEDDEVLEQYVKTETVRTTDVKKVLRSMFDQSKCFIPFNKFTQNGNQLSQIKNSQLSNTLKPYYDTNKPVYYTDEQN